MDFAVDPNSNYIIPDYLRPYIPWNFTNIPRVQSPLPVYSPSQVQQTTGREGDIAYSILPQYLPPSEQAAIAGGIVTPPTVTPLDPSIAGMSGYTAPGTLALGGSLFQTDPTTGQITGYPQGMTATQIDAILNRAQSQHQYGGGGQLFDPTDPVQLRQIIQNSAPDNPIGTSFGNLFRAIGGVLSGGGTEAGGALGTAIGSATGDPNAKMALGLAGSLAGGIGGAELAGPTIAGPGPVAAAGNAPAAGTAAAEVGQAASDISQVPHLTAELPPLAETVNPPIPQGGALGPTTTEAINQGIAEGGGTFGSFNPGTVNTSLFGNASADTGGLSLSSSSAKDFLNSLALANALRGMISPSVLSQSQGGLSIPGGGIGGGSPVTPLGQGAIAPAAAGAGAGGSTGGTVGLSPSQLSALLASAAQNAPHRGLAPPFSQRMGGLPEDPGLAADFTALNQVGRG